MSQYNNNASGNLGARGTYTQTATYQWWYGSEFQVIYDGAGIWTLFQFVEGDPQSQYEAFADGTAFPLTGWTTTNGIAPVPEFTLVGGAPNGGGAASVIMRRRR